MNKSHANKRLNQLPSWLWTNSTTLPPVYKMVWEAVREDRIRSNGVQTELLVDTNKVFPLLLTSQLPTEVLGHIWNLANQKYAGQLTEQELYVVLALVAAAQTSYTFNNLDILHLLPYPPTPYLNTEYLMNLQPSNTQTNVPKLQYHNNEESSAGIIAETKHVPDVKGKARARAHANALFDANVSFSNNILGKPSCFDIKTQIAAPGTTNNSFNNLFKDAKQISRAQTGVSSLDEPCDEFTEFQSAPIANIPAIPIWDSKQGSAIGSRLANHNLGVKKTAEKVKKSTTGIKTLYINTQIRTPVAPNLLYQGKNQPAIESELFPKCAVKSQSKTVILKDTVIRNNDTHDRDYSDDFNSLTNVTEIPHLSIEKEVLPKMKLVSKTVTVDASNSNAQQDLMSLQQIEDKYSALRALVQETSTVNDASLDLPFNSQSSDEFGEFMSAEQPFANPLMSDTLDTDSLSNMFADFKFKVHTSVDNSISDLNFASEISESFNNLKLDDGIEGQLVESGKSVQKEDAISINSVELISGPSEALPRSGSVPSLDLKSFLPSSIDEDQIIEAPQQNIYWEWKQYMESCVLLLQVAANIFTNITSELVLQEVLNSAQGYNFLCQLAEVAAVCRRVNFSYKELDINIIGFDDLLMDIDRIWAEMEPFYVNIPIVTELPTWPLHQGEYISCSLCLTVITSGRVIYNDNNYHVTCANLWLNCVNNHLPVMRYSLLYPQSNICPGSHI